MTHQPYDPIADLRGGRKAIEASAGTGKTYAITSNVLRLVVEDGLPMERLLLVTFTRAATAELEDRVRGRLVDGERGLRRAARDDDWAPTSDRVLRHVVAHARTHGLDEARRRIEEALRTVDQATVTTIHGFCHQVLQQAAVDADSDPSVAIDTDDDRLVAAVVDDWFVQLTHDCDEALVELLDDVGCTRTALQQLGRTVAGEPDPVLAPAAPEDLDPLAVMEDAHGTLRRAARDASDTIAAAQTAKDEGEITGNATWAPAKHRLLGRLDKLRGELADGGRPSASTLEGFDPEHVTGSGKQMPDRVASTSLPRAVEGLYEAAAEVETWIRRTLADHVRTELVHRRREAGTASFADLLRHLSDALDGDGGDRLVATVGAEFDAVLVDEFQDTDPVQWSILQRLFEDVDVFHVVGDPKQAIYGWRGADLQTYLQALQGADVRTMTTNWRSDQPYVDAVNHLLGGTPELLEDSLGGRGVRYVEVTTPDAPAHDAPRLVDAHGDAAAGLRVRYLTGMAPNSKPAVVDAIAQDVAQDIVDTIEAGLQRTHEAADGTTGRRDLVAADCAVLVRRHKEASAVADALRRRGVPVVVGGGDDVLTSDEADAMADLLRVLVAPGDDRALRRLLVGPFVGLDAVELDTLEDAAWQDHAVRAREWARTWAEDGIAAAVQRAIREGRAEARHARVARGDRTMTNLRHLTELLHLAEQSEALGTHALAAWFDARRAEAVQEQTPPERELRLERDDAAVRVMTVHAAKGREFPCVWVPFLWTREGLGQDRGDPFVVNDPRHDGRPRTVALHAGSRRVRGRSVERQQLREEYELAEWEGGLRLAYVALTRAQHRCTVHLCAFDHQGSLPASPGWQLFLAPELGDGRPTVDEAPAPDEDRLRQVLRDLAEHPTIHLDELAEPPEFRQLGADEPGERPRLDALEWAREEPLDVRWGRASFTGLLRGRAAPAPDQADASDEADTDQTADRHGHGLPELPRQVCEAAPDVPLAPLPRGAAWGTFLHKVLEVVDFDIEVDELEAALLHRDVQRFAPREVRPKATGHPADGAEDAREDEPDESAELRELVARGVHASLQTPLGPALDDLQLCRVDRGDRLDELDFTLALGEQTDRSFNVASIANVFEQHAGESDAPLAAAAEHLRQGGTGRPVHGLLIGSIDLVLRHDGRFWIADYKSNGLGQWLQPQADGEAGRWSETEAHTTPERVMIAMRRGDYLLQAHLYVVALHRYLRARLGQRYDYEQHVGGWAYLFLRGMTGEDVAHTHGLPHGIATGRPTLELVEELDAVLRGVRQQSGEPAR